MNIFILLKGLSIILIILSSWQIKKKKIYFFLVLVNILCFTQNIVLKAYIESIVNIICLIELLLFNFKGRNKFFKTIWPLMMIIILYVAIGITSYNNYSLLFKILILILYSVFLYQDREKIIRIGTSIMLLCNLLYSIFVHNYIDVIMISVTLLSSLLAILMIDVLKRYPHHKSSIIDRLKKNYYRNKVKEVIKVNFVDDYDILMDIFESEDNVISVMSRLEEYDRDKQILIKILLNISKSIKIDKS